MKGTARAIARPEDWGELYSWLESVAQRDDGAPLDARQLNARALADVVFALLHATADVGRSEAVAIRRVWASFMTDATRVTMLAPLPTDRPHRLSQRGAIERGLAAVAALAGHRRGQPGRLMERVGLVAARREGRPRRTLIDPATVGRSQAYALRKRAQEVRALAASGEQALAQARERDALDEAQAREIFQRAAAVRKTRANRPV